MCDYSLAEIRNRLALEGEELATHRFRTHTIGLISPCDLACGEGSVTAVCIPPGANLVLTSIPPYLQVRWGVKEEEPVVFTQTSMEVNRHRDAVQFSNGNTFLLQELPEGLRVKVCSLGIEATLAENTPTHVEQEFTL